MIKNILFDLDNTILDFDMAEREALKRTLIHFGVEPREETLKRYSEINLSQWKLLEKGEITREVLKPRRFKLLYDEIGVEGIDPAETTAFYENELGQGHYFMPGAPEIFESLCPDYRIYIASNGTAKVQHGRIDSAGIGKYLSGLFISQEVGHNKPSKEFFDVCFSEIESFKRDETVIVGDSLTSDILGGINAGIKTVWFNPKGVPNDTDIVPQYEISKLDELCGLLKRI